MARSPLPTLDGGMEEQQDEIVEEAAGLDERGKEPTTPAAAIVHSTQEEEEAFIMGPTLLGEILLPLYLRGEEEFFGDHQK